MAAAAEASADALIRSEGWDVQLEESLDLRLPFLLPEGGFSCDTMTGIPPGLLQFLGPVSQKGERKHDSANIDCFRRIQPPLEGPESSASVWENGVA